MSNLKGKRVALIGGAGFIGHHLALALVRRGAQVNAIDSLQVNNLLSIMRENSDHRELHTRMVQERLDLLREAGVVLQPQDARDYHALSRLINAEFRPQVIVQLAAVSHAGRSNKDPYSTFDHSLRTLENALDSARGCPVERFVFLSSSMAYGNFLTDTVDEEHPLNPIGIYGALKVAGERMVIAYQQVFNLPYTIIRPSALYGARCISRRVGQVFIENALSGTKLRVDGDGVERLDFTYIDDLVEGICLAIEQPEGRNQTFNLTYGQARPIKEVLEIVRKHFPDTVVEHVERDNLMPVRGTLSVDKAKRLLGYSPQNPIEVGFPKYIEWYRKMLQTNPPRRAPNGRDLSGALEGSRPLEP